MHKPTERWAVVGGGMLGMLLAHRLAQAGRQVTLFEAAPHLGGLTRAWQLGNITWDRNYHVTSLSDTVLRSLLQELGLEKGMRWIQTRTGFYVDDKLYSMSNAWEFLHFPPLNLIDKFRLGATIFLASRIKNWKKLEGIPVEAWLRKWSGNRLTEKIWLPLLRSKLGESYHTTSAAFIWATIQRYYAARRTGLKKEMFGYVPGGYARTLERFQEVLLEENVTIRLGHAARLVEAQEAGGVTLSFANGPQESFDQVVLTVAAPIAARLCPRLSEEERARLLGIQYLGIICASLLLKRPLAGFYVTNITDSWVPFTAVIEMSALVDPAQFGGHSLFYLPWYVSSDDPALAWPDSQIEERFVPALLRMYPDLKPEEILTFRVSREKYVMAIPTLHYSERLPPMTTSLPGVHIVNSAHIVNGTLNVNETLQLAEKAVAQLVSLPPAAPSALGRPTT
jgi:protoporphyrinogen oxidase